MQTSTWVWWAVAAVLVFWAMGAYNRLMRLRAEVKSTFSTLEGEMTRLVALVESCLPPEAERDLSTFDGTAGGFWAGLQGAAGQFAASLAAAKQRPLEPERIAALGAAQEVLEMAWERAERDDAHDLAGPRLPETVSYERAQIVRQVHVSIVHFNNAVTRYNEAIAEFPAILLAWVFGFSAGRGLRTRAQSMQ